MLDQKQNKANKRVSQTFRRYSKLSTKAFIGHFVF